MKISTPQLLLLLKNIILFKPFSKAKYNLFLREIGLFFLFAGIPIIIAWFWYPLMSAIGIRNSCLWQGQAIFISLAFFFACLFIVLLLCKLIVFQKCWFRNVIFSLIFICGLIGYIMMDSAAKKISTPSYENHTLFSSFYYSNTALAAFFPSRGPYETTAVGRDVDDSNIQYPENSLRIYMIFHVAVYIFAGYFLMSLWGYRTINRLRFCLIYPSEKNVFWCITPDVKMLKLAKDILKNGTDSSVPVFSVEETQYSDPKPIFQEMNYQKFCLKLRKPGQIHQNCLRAAKHFFLSEDSGWNITMAEALLKARSHIKNPAKLYIKIKNDARKIYYTRWADQYKNTNIEIIFIDECTLIINKFVHEHHVLKAFDGCIDSKTASVNKNDGFKFLLVGFGGLGQEILKYLLCDTQFLDANAEPVPISIDIIEKDTTRTALFQKQYEELCTNVSLSFKTSGPDHKNIAAGTAEFYSFFQENHKKYDRIIIALGDAVLNIETAAQIEDIIRKGIDLTQDNPEKTLSEWKEKIFLISPEIYGSVLQCKTENLFTLIGADNEIFNYSDIVNEKMLSLAKLISYRHNTGIVVSSENFEQKRDDIEQNWSGQDFYSRQSSYAAALGLDNTRLLLKNNVEAKKWTKPDGEFDAAGFETWFKSEGNQTLRDNLGKMEHLRWGIFMLCSGYICWENPQKCKTPAKANQTQMYRRHATMVKWDRLPEMDKIFPGPEKFKDKDLRIIDAMPYFFNIIKD